MDSLNCEKNHFHLVDSKILLMDNASGRFCYVRDPDGTLIELDQETHKVPIFKKNWVGSWI
jgi:hypothetical protein